MYLIKTSKNLWIGNVKTEIDDDGLCQHTVSNAKEYPSTQLLMDENHQPIFEANAFILDTLIVNRSKDTSQTCKALLSFFRFISQNEGLDWRATKVPNREQAIFLYRAKLNSLKDKGVYTDKTCAGYLSVIRRFYKFCFKHRYVDHLPYDITGKTKYQQDITNCTIRVRKKPRELRPLSERHLKYVYESWHVVPLEARLGILMSQFMGLREVEVCTMRKRLLAVPKDFEGRTFSGIPIGPRTNVHTKGGGDREISVPIWLVKLFEKYHNSPRYRARQAMYYEVYGDEDFPALLTNEGDLYSTDVLTAYWSKISKEVRSNDPFYKHRWHDNRATFGCAKMETLLDNTSCTPSQALALLQNEMGHTDPSTTQLYLAHWQNNPEQQIITEVMTNFVESILESIE